MKMLQWKSETTVKNYKEPKNKVKQMGRSKKKRNRQETELKSIEKEIRKFYKDIKNVRTTNYSNNIYKKNP